MKTVIVHIQGIRNEEIRKKCLENLDERCANLECYSVGYALMLGVNQPAWEKDFWQNAYWVIRTEAEGFTDTSAFYKAQPVQQDVKKK